MSTEAALARLEWSRARIREAMHPSPPNATPRPPATWMTDLKSLPVIGVMIEAVQSWWSQHPLRPVTMVVAEASNVLTGPLAQRNPRTLVLAAALVGAVLVSTRPWRWLFRSALLAGLVPQIASRVVSNLPIESWMTLLGSALAQTQPPTASFADESRGTSSATPDAAA